MHFIQRLCDLCCRVWCRKRPPGSNEDAWNIMEANRFLHKHSTTLTLPTPLPEVHPIFLEAEADMPDLPKLKDLEVCVFPSRADATCR